QARHLGHRELALVVDQPFAGPCPRLAEVGAPPDRGAVPLAAGGGVDSPALLVVDRVEDRPALAVGAAGLPGTAIVALEDEQAFPRADEEAYRGHRDSFTRVPSVSIQCRPAVAGKLIAFAPSSPGGAWGTSS